MVYKKIIKKNSSEKFHKIYRKIHARSLFLMKLNRTPVNVCLLFLPKNLPMKNILSSSHAKATRIETPTHVFSRVFCEILPNSILVEFLHSSKLQSFFVYGFKVRLRRFKKVGFICFDESPLRTVKKNYILP